MVIVESVTFSCCCTCTETIAGPDIARGEGLEDSSSENDEAADDEASDQRTGRKYKTIFI